MKVALFEDESGRRGIGIVDHDHLVDVSDWVGPMNCCPMASFIRRFEGEAPPLTGPRIPLTEVVWLPPTLGSSAPLCVGLNYADHATEVTATMRSQGLTNPGIFSRYWSSLTGHGQPVVRPQVSETLDFEGELVVVIGRHCRAVPREQALEVVAGYTVGQEGSVREWQRNAPTPTAGKNFWSSGSLGPWLVTSDEVPDPSALRLTTRLNGDLMQEASLSSLVFDVPTLIEHITAFMPLAPGDTIFTGTPRGTMSDRGGERWLRAGDTVSVAIGGIGTLTNHVIDELALECSDRLPG